MASYFVYSINTALICITIMYFMHIRSILMFMIVPLSPLFGPPVGLREKKECYVNASTSCMIHIEMVLVCVFK